MAAQGKSSIGVRVRPNAHDFIRDLRAQLGPKTYTFWVDVRARTGPASKDVREWANGTLKKISAVVPVKASTGQASADVADWRRRQSQFKTFIPIHANLGDATREVAAWRQLVSRDIHIKVKADMTGKGVEGIRRDLNRDATVRVRADTRQIRRDVQESLQDEQDSLFTVGVNADTKKAELKVRDLFEDVRGEQLSFDLDVDTTPAKEGLKEVQAAARALSPKQKLDIDLKEAKLKLLQLRIEEKAKKLEIDVQVKKNAFVTFQKSLKQFEKATGSFTPIRSLDLGPFNLGKPSGLIGTLTTITALAAAVPAVVTAISALSNGLVSLGAAAALVPGALGGILASLGTFSIATKGVGDAFSAMTELWDEGASEQASASRRLVQGQNNYRNALVDEQRAQERVSDARREALGDLRNLNNELKDGVLNEAQALLDLQRAKDRYAQGDFDNNTDRLQAELDIRKATQNVAEVREKNIDLQQRANKAGQQGVEGSDKVVDALEAQTRAQQQAAEAMEQMASSQATGALGKFNDQLAQLSPNAQSFFQVLAGSKGELTTFRNDLQDTVFSGLDRELEKSLGNLLPVVKPGMQRIAAAMNQNILQVFDTLSSPDGRSIIERILGGTEQAQTALTQLIDPLVRSFGTLIAAGTEHLPQVVNLITQLVDRFATFIQEADADGSLDTFLDKGVTALGQIAELGINAFKIINEFSKAFHNAFGEDLLTMLVRISGQFADFLGSAEGQKKINEYIQDARDIFAEWAPILKDLPGIFKSVSDGASTVLDKILPVIQTFADFMKDHPTLVAGLITAWLGAKVIISPILGIVNAFKGLFGLIAKIPGVSKMLASISAALGGSTGLITGVTPPIGGADSAGKPGAGGGAANGAARKSVSQKLFGGAQSVFNKVVVPALVTDAIVSAGAAGAEAQTGNEDVNKINAGLPEGVRPITGLNKDPFMLKSLQSIATDPSMAGTTDPRKIQQVQALAQWVLAGAGPNNIAAPGTVGADLIFTDPAAEIETSKRWRWLNTHPDAVVPPDAGSYMKGGYTPWPQQTGKPVLMHGKEYVQPADVTSYYSVDAMKAIHEKRIPREVLNQFVGGSRGAYGGGLQNIPLDGTWMDPNAPTPLRANEPNPAGGGWVSALTTGVNSAINVGTNLASQAISNAPGGGVDPNTTQHGAGNGTPVAPGPAPGTDPTATASPTTSDSGTLATLDLFGIKIPIGGEKPTWPGGQAPVGLGGGPPGPNGEAPFDIRNFGIGPGPPGSGPGDWAEFAGKTLGTFVTSATGALATGFLDAIGLGGILSGVQTASPLINHFLGGDKKAQGAGAAETDAQVTDLLATADSMAGNPAYPGVPGLPDVIDLSTGSALGASAGGGKGLQVNTARGEAIIKKYFPWATNIGGVRPDALKWHPSGLALDVMIPGQKGLNDPTTPEGLALGNQLYAWLNAHKAELGIDYMLWQEKDHYNHIHVNFAPSGYAPGSVPAADVPGPGNVPKTAIDNVPPTGAANGENLPAPPKPKAGQGAGLFGPNVGGKYKGGLIGFENGGLVNPRRPWQMGPGNFNPDVQLDTSHASLWHNQPALDSMLESGWDSAGYTGLPGLNPWTPGSHRSGGTSGPGGIFGSQEPGSARAFTNKVMDRGGWLAPGTTVVHNYTGKPELVTPMHSFYGGGGVPFLEGMVKPPTPPAPLPRPPDVQPMIPKVAQAPAPAVPSVSPSMAPPPPPEGQNAPPPPTQEAGPGGAPISLGPRAIGGNGPDQDGMHLHPALQKGIASGAAVAGNLASSAISAASFGMGGGGGAGGGLGGFVSGLISQGGKILTNIANVGASFLVGNITGGTTANAYGVTQRGNSPTGGSRVVDASTNQYGDIYTNNLDEYFAMKARQENVKAQSALGRWNT